MYVNVKYLCVYKHLCFYSCVKNIHVYTQLCFISVQNYLREPRALFTRVPLQTCSRFTVGRPDICLSTSIPFGIFKQNVARQSLTSSQPENTFFCCERLSASMARSLHLRFSLCTTSELAPWTRGESAASCQPQA